MLGLSLYGIQIRELITLPALSELDVIAGFGGLDNTVTNVNIMEVPDISDWVGEGQLILTTLYSIKDDSEALHKLLPMLYERGAAGLVIKLRRYIKDFPSYMIEQANALGFPLIEMPSTLSHPIVIEAVYSALAEKQMRVLKLTQAAHTQMVDTVVSGGKTQEICSLLNELFGSAVVLTDQRQRTRCQIGREEASGVSEEELYEAIRQIHFTAGHETGEQQLSNGSFLIASPIFLGKWLQGDICLFSESYTDIPVKRIVLGHAATIIAMLISHENELAELEQRYKNEFLHDWIYGKTASDSVIRQRAAQFGWDIKTTPVLLLVNAPDYISAPGLTLVERDKARKRVTKIIFETLLANGMKTYIYDGSDNIKVLIPPGSNASQDKLKSFTADAAELIHTSLLSVGIECYISSGKYYVSLSDLKKSFEEAASAMRIGRKFNRQSYYFDYSNQKLYGLLDNINTAAAGSYIDKYYLPISRYDIAHKTHLIDTIKTYVKFKGNTSQISKNLFTHYNTIQYRLEKINDITGLNIYDADDCMLLYFSILLGESEIADKVNP